MATSVGRLSSVELIPVSVTLSFGGFGVACAGLADAAVDGGVAAVPPQDAITSAMTTITTSEDSLSMSYPLRSEHGGRAPAEQAALDALRDLDQCDGEDHEYQQDQVNPLGVEEAGGDV